MTARQLEKLEKAEDILTDLYCELRDHRGSAKEAKRLDVILGKIYNLKFVKERESKI